MSAGLRPLKHLVCLVCLWAATQPALAATWQEQRDAGFRAFANTDYLASAEHLEKALAAARDSQAGPRELGEILDTLSNAYFAAGWFRRARDSIVQWDHVLEASGDEAWVSQQRANRDRLAVLVSELIGEPEADSQSVPSSPANEPAAAMSARSSEGTSVELEVDQPFAPDEPIDFATAQPTVPDVAAPAAEPISGSGEYAVHLVSLTDIEAVEGSWDQLKQSFPDLLAEKKLEVRQIEVEGQGTFYRIYAAPFADAAAARAACEAFQQLQQYCAVASLQ